MSALDLIAAAAFLLPGAVAVRLWDFFGWRQERSQLGMLGWALLVGAVEYSVIVLLGGDIRQVFTPEGALIPAKLLTPPNMGLYLGVLVTGGLLGSLTSALFHQPGCQAICARFLGRTFVESAWTEVARDAVDHWVILVLRSGGRVRGWVSSASARPEGGYLVLQHVAPWDPDGQVWAEPVDRFSAAFAVADIEYTMVVQPPAPEPDVRQAPAPARTAREPEPPRRVVERVDDAGGSAAAVTTAEVSPDKVTS